MYLAGIKAFMVPQTVQDQHNSSLTGIYSAYWKVSVIKI